MLSSRARKTAVIGAALGAALLFGAESCDGSTDSGQKTEDTSRQHNYDQLIKSQPAHTMSYSPTRATKNFWIDTWGTRGKVAYVYLRDANSRVFGYYVLDGLPVSYCTSLVPPVREWDVEGDSSGSVGTLGPAPSVDGTYASASNCNEMYGRDAVTGSYVEYSVGLGINQQISDQPLPQYGDAKPLGPGTIAKARSGSKQ